MITYNIAIQFPNHHFIGQTQINPESLENSNDLVTTFHIENGLEDHSSDFLKPIYGLMADFYDFGAKYFEKGKVNGDDVAAKLRNQLGEIYLGNPEKFTYGLHYTGVWPHSINFGELCFSSDPSFDLEITWKYKKCELCNSICNP